MIIVWATTQFLAQKKSEKVPTFNIIVVSVPLPATPSVFLWLERYPCSSLLLTTYNALSSLYFLSIGCTSHFCPNETVTRCLSKSVSFVHFWFFVSIFHLPSIYVIFWKLPIQSETELIQFNKSLGVHSPTIQRKIRNHFFEIRKKTKKKTRKPYSIYSANFVIEREYFSLF